MKHLALSPPDEMSPSARAREITVILATALSRTLTADSSAKREIPLGFLPKRSVHTTPYPEEIL